MAKGEASTGERKRRAPQGPRRQSPIYLAVQVQDASGNPIPDAQVNILYTGKSLEACVDTVDANPGSKRVKVGGAGAANSAPTANVEAA